MQHVHRVSQGSRAQRASRSRSSGVLHHGSHAHDDGTRHSQKFGRHSGFGAGRYANEKSN